MLDPHTFHSCTQAEAWLRVDTLTAGALEGDDMCMRLLPWWIQHALRGGCK